MPRGKSGRGGKRMGARKYRLGRRKAWQTTKLVNTARAPVPQRFITKHKYSTTFTIGSTQPTYQFNLNSLYDPDLTSFGHQPYGRDQMALLYSKYRVYGVSYMISGYQAGGQAIRIACIPTSTTAPPTPNLSSVIEQPRSKYITQLPGGGRAVLKGYVNLPSLIGMSRRAYSSNPDTAALSSSNPIEAMVLTVMAQSLVDTTLDSSNINLTLTFHCEWFDPIAFSTS